MAGTDFWSVTGDGNDRRILSPDGTNYANPFDTGSELVLRPTGNNNLDGANSIVNITVERSINQTVAGRHVFINNKQLNISNIGQISQSPLNSGINITSNGTHLWFVNCVVNINANSATQVGAFRSATSLAGTSPSFTYVTPDLTTANAETTTNTINFLGCEVNMISTGTDAFIHGFGHVEDTVINSNREGRMYHHLGGTWINSRFDGSLITNTTDGGAGLFWTDNAGATFTNTSVVSNPLAVRKPNATGPSFTAVVEGYSNPNPIGANFNPVTGVGRGQYAAVILARVAAGAFTGFRLDNPRDFAEFTFPATGNEVNTAVAAAGAVPASPIYIRNAAGGADQMERYRLTATALYNPLIYDDSALLVGQRTQAGVPNVHIAMERGYNFATGTGGNSNVLVPNAPNPRPITHYETGSMGFIEAASDPALFNPNGTSDIAGAGSTAAIAAGDGLRTPFLMVGSNNFAATTTAANTTVNEARLYRTNFRARSMSHILDENTFEIATQIGPEYHLPVTDDIQPGVVFGQDGIFAPADDRVSAEILTIQQDATADAFAETTTLINSYFPGSTAVSPQQVYDLVRYLHTYTAGQLLAGGANGLNAQGFTPPPITGTFNNETYLDMPISITLNNTLGTPWTWDEGDRILTIRTNELTASRDIDTIQGLRLVREFDPVSAQNVGGNINLDDNRMTGANVIATTITNISTDQAVDAIVGGSLAGEVQGPTNQQVRGSGNPDLSGLTVTAGNFLFLSVTLSADHTPTDLAGITIFVEILLPTFIGSTSTNQADRGYITVWQLQDAPAQNDIQLRFGNLFIIDGQGNSAVEDVTVNGNVLAGRIRTTADVVRITQINSTNTMRVVHTHPDFQAQVAEVTGGGTVNFSNVLQEIPATVATGSSIVINDDPSIALGGTTSGANPAPVLRVDVASAFTPPPSAGQTNNLIHRDIKAALNYQRMLAILGPGNDTNILRSGGSLSPGAMAGARFNLQPVAGTTLQGLGYIGFIDPDGAVDETLSLSTANLGTGVNTGVLVYPASEFDLPLTISSLSNEINNATYIQELTDPAVNAVTNFLETNNGV